MSSATAAGIGRVALGLASLWGFGAGGLEDAISFCRLKPCWRGPRCLVDELDAPDSGTAAGFTPDIEGCTRGSG